MASKREAEYMAINLPQLQKTVSELVARTKALEDKPAPKAEVSKKDFDALGKEVHDESLEANKVAARVTALEGRAEAVFTDKLPAAADAKKGVLYFSTDQDGNLTVTLVG